MSRLKQLLTNLGGELIHHKDFRRRWLGATISIVGSEISNIALPAIALLQFHASAIEVAVLIACQRLAFPILALPAGELIDRWSRKKVMIISDVVRAAILVSIPIASAMHSLSMAILVVVALLVGIFTVFFEIAAMSFTPELLKKEQLVEGNTKLQFSLAFGLLIGPALGGLLVTLLGGSNAVAIDASSFLISGLLLLFVKTNWKSTAKNRGTIRQGVNEGLQFVRKQPILFSLLIGGTTTTIGYGMAETLLPLLAYRSLHMTPALLGLIIALSGFGGVVGAPLATRAFNKFGLGLCIAVGWSIGSGAIMIVAPLAFVVPALPLLSVAAFVGGVVLFISEVGQISLRQMITPAHLQGRMNATIRSVYWGAWPIGNILAGAFVGIFGVIGACAWAAGELILAGAFILPSAVGKVKNIQDVEVKNL